MKLTKWTPEEVNKHLKGGEQVIFLDTRSPEAWDKSDSKIVGALRVPPDEALARLPEIPTEQTIVTYCTCPQEASSMEVAQVLLENGWQEVHPLIGGFDAWKQADYPTVPK
jgi:rhodanese-related sulfurtransferase